VKLVSDTNFQPIRQPGPDRPQPRLHDRRGARALSGRRGRDGGAGSVGTVQRLV